MKRELDETTRPHPIPGEILDHYINRYLRWLESEMLQIMNDTIRRQVRRNQRAHRVSRTQHESLR